MPVSIILPGQLNPNAGKTQLEKTVLNQISGAVTQQIGKRMSEQLGLGHDLQLNTNLNLRADLDLKTDLSLATDLDFNKSFRPYRMKEVTVKPFEVELTIEPLDFDRPMRGRR